MDLKHKASKANKTASNPSRSLRKPSYQNSLKKMILNMETKPGLNVFNFQLCCSFSSLFFIISKSLEKIVLIEDMDANEYALFITTILRIYNLKKFI